MKGRVTLDSNVLVYSELEPETEKGKRSSAIIGAADAGGVVAVQALLEFMAVVRRKRPESLASAAAKVEAWSRTFELAPTTTTVAHAALTLSREHDFQIWDAVIWCAAKQAGASMFLSEDLHDGLALDGMTVVNPFRLAADAFATLLTG